MPQSKMPLFNQLQNWLDEVQGTKTAAVRDPGGYKGPTSHPSKSVDDHTEEAKEGFRSKENTEDNKEDRGPASVDSTKPGSGGTQESHQIQVGTTKSEVGDQPSVEDDYKSDKDDPGTSHPANADEVGEKYASLARDGKLEELLKLHKQASNNLLAKISVAVATPKSEQPAKASEKEAETKKAEETKIDTTNQTAANAGYELAAILGYQTKESADAAASNILAAIIKEANEDADRVGPFMLAYLADREKKAKEAASKKVAAEGGDLPPPGEGEIPPEAAAALGAEGGPAPGGPEGGEAPPPGPEGGEAPGGGMGQDEAMQQLVMGLIEMGLTPEMFAQMAAQAGGGAGGPPPGAGGPPPDAAMAGGPPPDAAGGAMPPPGSPADMGAKIASAARDFMRSGKFRIEPAKTAAERKYRDEMKSYIREIMGAGR